MDNETELAQFKLQVYDKYTAGTNSKTYFASDSRDKIRRASKAKMKSSYSTDLSPQKKNFPKDYRIIKNKVMDSSSLEGHETTPRNSTI